MPAISLVRRLVICCLVAATALPHAAGVAATPRELLTIAAFETVDRPKALALIGQAIAVSNHILASQPGNGEAALQRGIAIGYRAKLTRSRADARTSLAIFEMLAARNPNDPEAQIAIAGWHLDAIDQLGGFLARTAVGAKTRAGDAALARAVALGGSRAFYPGLAGMMQLRRADRNDGAARKWLEFAAGASTPTPLDERMKRNAISVLAVLRLDRTSAAVLARKLLPFGTLAN